MNNNDRNNSIYRNTLDIFNLRNKGRLMIVSITCERRPLNVLSDIHQVNDLFCPLTSCEHLVIVIVKFRKKITFHIIDTGQMVAPITIKHYNVIGWFALTIFFHIF